MTAREPAVPRQRPCASCPYRRVVPSGVWDSIEYSKLPEYDRDLQDQPSAVFYCHQGDGDVCSGWLGHRDPSDLLAVRLGLIEGRLEPSCIEYQTNVPLFPSGAEAAAHGTKDIASPSDEAWAAMDKLIRKRGLNTST